MGKKGDKLFAVYLINLTTNMRIWEALNSDPGAANMNILRSILKLDPSVGRACTLCSSEKAEGAPKLNPGEAIHDLGLNKSQEKAIVNYIATKDCHHQNTVQLIWGPPGTGKTKTVASLLFVLLQMKCRTLTCAPTNVAVLGVINRLMALVRPTLECDTYGLGDIVLFGNQRRMQIDDSEELFGVFLDNRVSAIAKCLNSTSGFKRSIVSMILLLEDPEEQYQHNLNKTPAAPQKRRHKKEEREMTNSKKIKRKQSNVEENVLTFEDFFIKNFNLIEDQLSSCMKSLYTHMPTSVIEMEVAKNMIKVVDMLQALRTLFQNSVASNGGLRDVLFGSDCRERRECLLKLELIQRKTFLSLPILVKDDQIRSFCLNKGSLIFCTASSSSMLHTELTERRAPVELVIIDEAAQLKECEAAVPLQLLGLRHAILVGDEKQLPAMVQSKESEKVGFGRSLFERLAKLGYPKHLLNEQRRMHPSISSFPNTEFYGKQIMDGPNVRDASYKKHYLEGCMYGSYILFY